MNFSSFFNKNKTLIFLIFAFGIVVYFNALGNAFVWDDEEMVVKNFPLFTLGNLPSLFTQATFYGGGSSLEGWFYRPMVMASFLLIKVFFGTSPFGYHLVQIVFHLLNSVLIFWILGYLFRKKNEGNLIAFFASLIYAVHPGLVESVSYIASIAEPLYTFFLLSFFILFVKSEEKELFLKEKVAAFAFLLLSFLTKEGALVGLPVAFLYLYFFNRKKAGFWSWILFGSFLSYLFVRLVFFGIQKQTPHFFAPLAQAPFEEKLLTLPFIIFSFFRTFFTPIILAVSQHEVVKNPNWNNFGLPLLVIVIFVIVVLLFLRSTKSKLGLFFILWFVLGIMPATSLIFPLDMTFAERWLYFPAIGLLGFLGTMVLSIKDIKKFRSPILFLGILIVTLLGIRTMVRNSNWKDGLTLYSHDIVNEPMSFDLQNNLGVELVRKGKWDEALPYIQKSVDLQPQWTISTNNMGAVYEHLGDAKKAEDYYKKSIDLGDYYLAYENYAMILVKEKKFKEANFFLQERALPKFPNNEKLIQIYLYIQNQEKLLFPGLKH